MSACPVCGKPVDQLRAPAAKIRDGKIVAYCSKDCASLAETKPTAVPPAASPAVSSQLAQEKLGRRTPGSGVASMPKPVRDLDSGPVIEIVREPESAPVAALSAAAPARAKTAPVVRKDETDGAIEIADTGHVDDYVDLDPPRRRGVWIVVLVFLILGGAAVAAWQLGYVGPQHADRARAAVTPQAKVTTAPTTAPKHDEPSPRVALDRAHTLLTNQLHSDSGRVQRVAAAALARTGDSDARAALVTLLGKETSDIGKLELAYALARAGDSKGADMLVAALAIPRRDVRAEAARRLAMLGDKRATAPLDDFFAISQFRLGAAEQLALLADPQALDMLDKLRKDATASNDDRARAAIALGLAGRTGVADVLHGLLTDARENSFAAAALATLHDEAARPVLVKQLTIPSLRVGAARALRRLDPKLDATPLLAPLLATLASGKDTEQVQAAEAIMLLAGPASWSARE
jgi:HEAT repeat protein